MKVILFGAGYFGKNYLRDLSHNLVGVVETNPETAKEIESTFNVKVYPELPDIEFDAGVIVTPPESHVELAKSVLEQGKYCLIEKPLAMSVEEGLRLWEWKDKIFAAMIYLYHPLVEELKRGFDSTKVNHIFTRRSNNGPIRTWQNVLWDLATHDVSILNYLTGEIPTDLDCISMRDWAILNLQYRHFQSNTYVSWVGGPKIRKVEVVYNDYAEREIFDDMAQTLEVSPLRLMLDDFLSGDWDEKSNFREGLEVINVIEKASQL